MEGRCQCGRIRFTTPTASPFAIYICHCTECRHQSSSAYGITLLFPDFALPEEGVATYSRPNSVGKTMGYFCTTCGARLMHKSIDARTGRPGVLVSVKGGCVDALSKDMMRAAVHIWTSEAIVDFPLDGSFEGEPEEGSLDGEKEEAK